MRCLARTQTALYLITFYILIAYVYATSTPAAPAASLDVPIPNGYRASIDSTGLFMMIWRLSTSALDAPDEYALDAMVFRNSAFANGRSPRLSERRPIAFADVTYRYERPHDTAAALAVQGGRSQITATRLAELGRHYVQDSRALRPTSTGSMYAPSLRFPAGVISVSLLLSMRVVLTETDTTQMLRAIANGAIPATPNAVFRATNSSFASSALISSFDWTQALLAQTTRRLDTLLPGEAPAVDAAGAATLATITSLATRPLLTLPSGAPAPNSPVDRGGYFSLLFAHTDLPAIAFFAPDSLIPLSETANRPRPRTAAAQAASADPSALLLASVAASNAANGTLAQLVPYTPTGSPFTGPHVTLAFWPQPMRYQPAWVDVQLQLQLIPAPAAAAAAAAATEGTPSVDVDDDSGDSENGSGSSSNSNSNAGDSGGDDDVSSDSSSESDDASSGSTTGDSSHADGASGDSEASLDDGADALFSGSDDAVMPLGSDADADADVDASAEDASESSAASVSAEPVLSATVDAFGGSAMSVLRASRARAGTHPSVLPVAHHTLSRGRSVRTLSAAAHALSLPPTVARTVRSEARAQARAWAAERGSSSSSSSTRSGAAVRTPSRGFGRHRNRAALPSVEPESDSGVSAGVALNPEFLASQLRRAQRAAADSESGAHEAAGEEAPHSSALTEDVRRLLDEISAANADNSAEADALAAVGGTDTPFMSLVQSQLQAFVSAYSTVSADADDGADASAATATVTPSTASTLGRVRTATTVTPAERVLTRRVAATNTAVSAAALWAAAAAPVVSASPTVSPAEGDTAVGAGSGRRAQTLAIDTAVPNSTLSAGGAGADRNVTLTNGAVVKVNRTLPLVRLMMQRLVGARTNSTQALTPVYYLDANLVVLREPTAADEAAAATASAAVNGNSAVSVALDPALLPASRFTLVVLYQFLFRDSTSNTTVRTEWSAWGTDVPTRAQTRPASTIPPTAALPPFVPGAASAAAAGAGRATLGPNEVALPLINNATPLPPDTRVRPPPEPPRSLSQTPTLPTAPVASPNGTAVAQPERGAAGAASSGANANSTTSANTSGSGGSGSGNAVEEAFRAHEFPTSQYYPMLGWNVTWFLLNYQPSSPYLIRHDVIHVSRDAVSGFAAGGSAAAAGGADWLPGAPRDALGEHTYMVVVVPSLVLDETADVEAMSIDIYINDEMQGTFTLQAMPAAPVEPASRSHTRSGQPFNLHDDPQAYVRPYAGKRYVSPQIALAPNDLLAYMIHYTVRPKTTFIPIWADRERPAYKPVSVTTTLFPFEGVHGYAHAILPISAVAPDPAEVRTAPIFKYSVKFRSAMPSARAALHFVVGRMAAHEGGLLAVPPIDPGVCFASNQGLPLRSRHNVWMRREFMPVSVSPVSTAVTLGPGVRLAFVSTLPRELQGPWNIVGSIGDDRPSVLSEVIGYVVSTLPPLLEEWWYFDGLVNSTSSLIPDDDGTSSFRSTMTTVIPFPDKDPGLPLRATPNEDLMIYAVSWWPEHSDRAVTTSSMIYSPDTYTTTGRAMGYSQGASLLEVCF